MATASVGRSVPRPQRGLLGSPSFLRLWLAQVVSSLGDWIGMVAIISLAARVGGSSSDAAVGLVMSARMIPGIFLAPVGGVLVDRWDRKRVMVTCDIGRGLVLLMLPFVDTLPALFLASLLLEIMTLLWSPAKEASVPNMVAADKLTSANSLSLAAAYGTFPVGSAVFALLAKVAETLTHNHALHAMRLDRRETLAIDADVLTFFCSAVLISTLALPRRARAVGGRVNFAQTFTELRDGLRFIATSRVVRAVIVGIGTGLVGGAMVVPLGPTFSIKVLHAGPAGFGLLLTALGTGAGIGVVGLSTIQQRVPRQRLFPIAVVGAGAFMLGAASMSKLAASMAFVCGMGICSGIVYVLGFTILQEEVADELRGRVFATLYTTIRFCSLVALTGAPLLAGLLDRLPFSQPGARLTLWFGSVILLGAGVLAAVALFQRRPDVSADPS